MASAPEKQSPEVEALIRRLDASRDGLGDHLVDLREALDVPARVKSAVKKQPWIWFGGSLGFGMVASRLLRRPRKSSKREPKKRRWFGFLVTTLFTLLKPTVMRVITSELQRRLIDHAGPKSGVDVSRFPLSKS